MVEDIRKFFLPNLLVHPDLDHLEGQLAFVVASAVAVFVVVEGSVAALEASAADSEVASAEVIVDMVVVVV